MKCNNDTEKQSQNIYSMYFKYLVATIMLSIVLSAQVKHFADAFSSIIGTQKDNNT